MRELESKGASKQAGETEILHSFIHLWAALSQSKARSEYLHLGRHAGGTGCKRLGHPLLLFQAISRDPVGGGSGNQSPCGKVCWLLLSHFLMINDAAFLTCLFAIHVSFLIKCLTFSPTFHSGYLLYSW